MEPTLQNKEPQGEAIVATCLRTKLIYLLSINLLSFSNYVDFENSVFHWLPAQIFQ